MSQFEPQSPPQAATFQTLLELCTIARERPLADAELATLNTYPAGLDVTLGFRYTRVAPEGVTVELDIDDRHLQPWGLVNGGVLCSLAESAGSLAGFIASGGAPVVGVNNDTNFISAVRSGTVQAVVTPVQTGRTTQLWKVDMMQQDKLKATTLLRTMVLGN